MAPTPKDKERELLKKLSPLNTLSERELDQLLQEVSVQHLKRGEYLFREGATDPENVYLLSGKIALLKGETEVETLTGNTDSARFAVAHQFPRQHTARAKSHIEFVRINSHRLSELIDSTRDNAYRAEKSEQAEEDWKSLLLQSRIFQLIPRANIQHVMNRMEEVQVHKDEEIILQGEEGDYFYLISKGRCSVSQKPTDNHHSIEVAQLSPGDCFGEDALLSDNLRNSTVSMLTEGILMRLSKDDFIDLIKHPLATTINFSDACKITAANGIWLDIRSPEEYQQGHMDGSINLPLNSLRFQISSLVSGRQYIIYCQDGRYSTVAAFLLLERGFDAAILSGGLTSIPEKELTRRSIQPAEKGAKVISLRPGVHSGIAQHEELTIQRDEANTRAQALENQLTDLKQEIEELRSGKKEQAVEMEVLLTTAREQAQIESEELQTLRNKTAHLQQQLTRAEKEKEKAVQQLKEQSKRNRVMEGSSLLCTPDVLEMDRTIQQQASPGHEHNPVKEALSEKERVLQTTLNKLEQQTGSTLDAVDQEVVRQELEQLRAAIKERSFEMEQAILEQRSLEDALEDRDAHLEQTKQELEQLKVKLESTTTRYDQAEDAHRHAEATVERLKKQLQSKQGYLGINTATRSNTAGSGRRIKSSLLSMLVGGLLCFCILNTLLVLNGKDEIIFSLSGERAVQEMLSGWLASEEINKEIKTTPPKSLDRKKSIPKAKVRQPKIKPVAAAPVVKTQPAIQPRSPKVIRDRLQDGSLGPAMVEIPAGSFLMGSDRNTLKQDERPVHRVELKRYYAGRYEVTFKEYDRFAAATGRTLPDDQGWGRGRRPVINVDWDDAVAYSAWLSAQTGAHYRLPTEAEWEYAAGAGSSNLYWWGYKLEENQANCYNCGVKWAGDRTAPVGIFKANTFGLHNTAGNVMEWIQDCYSPNYIDAATDGSAWTPSLCKQQVVRGGAYSKSGMSMRTTERNKQAPSSRLSILGFRVVRE